MNRFIKLSSLLLIALLISCSGAERDWRKAEKKNTITAFEDFIEKYPESTLLDKAYENILSLRTESLFLKIFSEPQDKIDVVGRLFVLKDGNGIRSNSKQFGSVRYIERNDTIWIIHFKASAYYLGKDHPGEDYILKGSLVKTIEDIPDPILVERRDLIPGAIKENYESLSARQKNFASSDSLRNVSHYRKHFTPGVYNQLSEIYLLDQEYVMLNNYIECIEEKTKSIDGKITLSVLADSLIRVNRVKKPEIHYTFNSENILDLTENEKRKDIITTSSGLQYEIIKEGTGEKPVNNSKVSVHYEGLLPNGIVFDSSYEKDRSLTFSLERAFKGWQEGLQLMSVGSIYIFYIPPELGYGPNSTGPIPANSSLIFTVELLKVEN